MRGTKTTGERPTAGSTPDSVIALHDAGYREVIKRLGSGMVLDLGCGYGFETAKMADPARRVIGVDYDLSAARAARHHFGSLCTFVVGDCSDLGLKARCADYVCSSHLIEHFATPSLHVAEVARILKPEGKAFFITPNAPADFENPFHLVLFTAKDLASLLSEFFGSVAVLGIEGTQRVKEEVAARREKASRVYRLDFLNLRHKIPRRYWQLIYSSLLPLAQRLVYRNAAGGRTGIGEEDFFISEAIDDSTPALLAIAEKPL